MLTLLLALWLAATVVPTAPKGPIVEKQCQTGAGATGSLTCVDEIVDGDDSGE